MKTDVLIIGAGIVGLATALNVLEKNKKLKVLIVEKESEIAQHQSSHNSGVIHSGIYYTPNSLKAKNCISGYKKLLQFCQQYDIKHSICGKIIVAVNEEELPILDAIYNKGVQNGLQGLSVIEKEQINEYEPHCTGIKAIHVPQAGIVDYLDVAKQYAACIRALGGTILLNEPIKTFKNKEAVTSNQTIQSKVVINCSGLYSDKIAQKAGIDVSYKIIPFRGEYYKLIPEKEYLVNNLIYPVPNPNFPFLGVHFTRMIHGGIEAGPNAVLAFRREGYTKKQIHIPELLESLFWPGFQKVAKKYWKTGIGEMRRSFSKKRFVQALQSLIPDIASSDVVSYGAGVRAQACLRNGQLMDDFYIQDEGWFINVGNAPSPAATSSLSIGATVSDIAMGKF